MEWKPTKAIVERSSVRPNLLDYEQTYAEFSWETVRRELDGPPHGQGINIAHEAVDRHANGPRRRRVALRWLGKQGEQFDFTYGDLQGLSNRFANVLRQLGVVKGDKVFVLAGRIPDLYIAALGTWKNGSIFCPLFSAFGPEPIFQRMSRGQAKILVTTEQQYAKKVARQRPNLPHLQTVLLVDRNEDVSDDILSLSEHMLLASDEFEIPPTGTEDIATIHFTSGTTGMPKGAIHVHSAVVTHYMTAKYALDLHPDDLFWCTADPGWVTGTSYGLIAPLLHGVTNLVDEAEFDADRWYRILEEHKVTVWYTAPTAIRRLMRLDINPLAEYDLSHLRFIASVGEPLNPEAVVWGQEVLNRTIHDNWWQTETGAIMIANYAAEEVRPGSMGRPLPGIEAAIVRSLPKEDRVELISEPGVDGDLALRPGWPAMFRGYLHEEERYCKCFVGGWYITGDLAMRDKDGYFWFVGRADDIIKTAGHMVGPFEVESALMEHPAVAVGIMQALEPEDAVVATYREHGQALARGVSMASAMAEMYGKQEGCARGRGGSMHLFDAATHFYGGNAIVGGGLPVAVGLALADKMQGRRRATTCFFGDGAVQEGEFHESMNLAALWQLPVLFVCENNLYAMGVALAISDPVPELVRKAEAYGVAATAVDGMDVLAVETAAQEAVAYVRQGHGPYFLECRTYRYRAHSMFDAELYHSKEEIEEWKKRDPILNLTRQLQVDAQLNEAELAQLEREVAAEVNEAVAFAEAGTWEPVADLERFVYSERRM